MGSESGRREMKRYFSCLSRGTEIQTFSTFMVPRVCMGTGNLMRRMCEMLCSIRRCFGSYRALLTGGFSMNHVVPSLPQRWSPSKLPEIVQFSATDATRQPLVLFFPSKFHA